ncbi:MAG: hypothetical protein EB120_11525, partial [Proteobacteria bacterium]|nr:hypothetical protein [Pseudomonadota bacterium]
MVRGSQNRSRLKNRRGSTLVDYLMITVAIVGIIVPVFMNYFGGPFLATLANNKTKLVEFIGQTPKNRRKPPVPVAWFSRERSAKPQVGDLKEAGDLPPGAELSGPSGLSSPGDLKTGDLKEVGELKEPGTLNAGNVNGPG